jgi:ATP adenylyltransferase/5',5'''-P-1,P-4-tetraphosphate phosphorylase II
MAAYGFLVSERIAAGKAAGTKKTSPHAKCLPFPLITSLAAAQRAQRHVSNSIATIRVISSVVS